jgi:hypothetical protein
LAPRRSSLAEPEQVDLFVQQELIELRKHRENGMGMMIVRHKVRDYGQWRPIFDRHAECRRRRALSIHGPTIPPTTNKSEIVSSSIQRTRRRLRSSPASTDLKDAMVKAGVFDTPTIYFLESID